MGYLGIELDELICLLSRGHEAVFSLNGNQYIIQPVQSASLYGDLVMYQFKPHLVWLCRIPISPDHSIDKAPFIRWPVGVSMVEQLLNERCLNGKSFMDRLLEIHVDEVF